MRIQPPTHLLEKPLDYMLADTHSGEAALFVRTDAAGLQRLPRACPLEVRIGVWDCRPVLLVAVLARVAHSDAHTYETWLNPSDGAAALVLHHLAQQRQIWLHMVAPTGCRSLRARNVIGSAAGRVLERLRARGHVPAEAFERELSVVQRLYQTPRQLWRCCPDLRAAWSATAECGE